MPDADIEELYALLPWKAFVVDRNGRRFADLASVGMMIDTHVARDTEANEQYMSGGKIFAYKKYREGRIADAFSGMYDHAKWLRLQDIVDVLKQSGFGTVRLVEEREERNGPRVLCLAKR